MAWIESHEDVGQHPKTRRLARSLQVSIPTAVGYLHLLWHWALKYAEDGNLERFTREDIADGAMWTDAAETFVLALTQSGFLDETPTGLLVHDWNEYAGRLVQRRQLNRERMQAARATHVADTGLHVGGYRTQPTVPTKPTKPTKPTEPTVPTRPRESAASPPHAQRSRILVDPFGEAFLVRMAGKFAGLWTREEVKERIQDAMNHKASDKSKDKSLYVQAWLRRDAERLHRDRNGSSPDEDTMKREAAELERSQA